MTKTIHVDQRFHRTLIGPGGKYKKRLSEKYDLLIQFPPREGLSASTATFAGMPLPRNEDEIVLRGHATHVDAAIKEMLELVDYEVSLLAFCFEEKKLTGGRHCMRRR